MRSRSSVVADGLFDSRPYGFAQVTVVPTPARRGAALASVDATLGQVGALRLYIRQSHMHEGKAISAALRAKFVLDLDRRDEPCRRAVPDRGRAIGGVPR
jgi:hypothetical protein